MSGFHNNALIGAGSSGYQIERSLRFNSPDSAYLNRTPASAGNRKTWTWSGWVKRATLSAANNGIFSAGTSFGTNNDNLETISFPTSDTLEIASEVSGATRYRLITTQVFRDVSAFYHVVVAVDTTQATSTNRIKLYINGVQVTAFGTSTYPAQNYDCWANSTNQHRIGSRNQIDFNGYLTEINFIDGQALTPSSFGETNPVTGVWGPKRYAGTYGTNGFYLKFADNSNTTAATLGKDSSGNGNNWTPNNFSVTAGAGNDSMIDVPTPYADGGNGRGNYCTLNPLDKYSSTIGTSDGNLRLISTSGGSYQQIRSTIGMSNGKYYMEWIIVSQGTAGRTGAALIKSNSPLSGAAGSDTYSWVNHGDGYAYFNNNLTALSTGSISTGTDIVMYAFDADSGKLWMGKNGTWDNSGNPATGANPIYSGLTNGPYFFGGWAYNTSDIVTFNFGQRAFAYTPPTGFLALNTQNLPEPSIKKPSSYMDVALFTGTGASQNVTGLNFTPDLVWRKGRSAAESNILVDAVRGASLGLVSNSTGAEIATDSTTAFLSNGFTTIGTNAVTYVAWCWDESATPGFDIVTYTGNGTARSISHNLGVTPSMIIIKCRSAARFWFVNTTGITATQNLYLQGTDSVQSDGVFTGKSSTTFSIGSGIGGNANGDTYVAYLWSEVAGFSKFGSYTGNGSTDGPFVHCGFRPRFVMVKRTDSTSDWGIYDSAREPNNQMTTLLFPNGSYADTTGYPIDFLSNGFKHRNSSGMPNASGGTYIFAAFAESPFKYSLAR